jgi:hypothetical protein
LAKPGAIHVSSILAQQLISSMQQTGFADENFQETLFTLSMSLPPATKDISERPKAGSVVAPTDKAAKEADVSGTVSF